MFVSANSGCRASRAVLELSPKLWELINLEKRLVALENERP
jgi:hypothetical protein